MFETLRPLCPLQIAKRNQQVPWNSFIEFPKYPSGVVVRTTWLFENSGWTLGASKNSPRLGRGSESKLADCSIPLGNVAHSLFFFLTFHWYIKMVTYSTSCAGEQVYLLCRGTSLQNKSAEFFPAFETPTRIERQRAFSGKRSGHIYFVEDNLWHGIPKLRHVEFHVVTKVLRILEHCTQRTLCESVSSGRLLEIKNNRK